jgi:hypothetical protein
MSQPRRNDTIDQIEPTPILAGGNESKRDINHYEDVEGGIDEKMKDVSDVQDSDARGYVNPDLAIDEAENKRLRRIINFRYVSNSII